MGKCFCVFLGGILRIENWQRKQSYRKTKNEKRNIGCYSNASDEKHNKKLKNKR